MTAHHPGLEYPILQFFDYGHLPPHLQKISKPFCKLAMVVSNFSPDDSAATVNRPLASLSLSMSEFLADCEELDVMVRKLDQAMSSPSTSVRLRLLLEAKDCAVRAGLSKK